MTWGRRIPMGRKLIVEIKLYEIRELIELAVTDHPEDYNLEHCLTLIDETIMEVE